MAGLQRKVSRRKGLRTHLENVLNQTRDALYDSQSTG